MKLKLLAPVVLLLLSACATTQPPEVVIKTEYVVRKADGDLKRLPPYPVDIDVKKASQTELALWIAESEKRQQELERIIQKLIEFYERPITNKQEDTK